MDIVLVPSKKSKELLLRGTKLFPEIFVYYNGYNFRNENYNPDKNLSDFFIEKKQNKLSIVVIARLERQKRIDRMLKLFKKLSEDRSDLVLFILGDGDLKKELIQESKLLGIDSKVFILDYVPNTTSYYNFFDIIVFTSDWEGMPLTMWEAMAHKVPIVAPDVGGLKKYLK